MKSALISLVILFSVLMLSMPVTSLNSRTTQLAPMQEDNEPALMASNYASIAIDGDLSEWSPDEFRDFDTYADQDRERNMSVVAQIAFNETHYFGYLEIEDDPLFSAFPFNDNESKIADRFQFEFYDAARVAIHDGFACMIVDETYEEEIFEAWGLSVGNNTTAANFASVSGTTFVISDLDYINENSWNVTQLNSSTEWVNASYEDGHYTIWFAKSTAGFNVTANPYGLKSEAEFSRASLYTDGVISPLNENSSFCYPRPMERRFDIINASSEDINSLDWTSYNSSIENSVFSKIYWMRKQRTFSMAFRNNGEQLSTAMKVDFPYVNETTQAFGKTYAPLYMQFWFQVNQTVAGEQRSTTRTRTTIFNDNVTGLFAGIQEIEEIMGPYPNNVDHGQWWSGDTTIPQELSFAYTADRGAQNTYFIELSTELEVLDVEEWGNGTHGAELAVGSWFWMDYFNLEEWSTLVNLTEEQRLCSGGGFGLSCALWRLSGDIWVGGDDLGPQPWGFPLATALFPIRNVTISHDESQGVAIVQARFVDEEPFTSELIYHFSGGPPETVQFYPSMAHEGFHYAEIPNLENGDQVIYQISIKDRFNTTITIEETNFRFGTPPESDSTPANPLFAFLSLIILVLGRIILRRKRRSACVYG